jgi:hypothetical protein
VGQGDGCPRSMPLRLDGGLRRLRREENVLVPEGGTIGGSSHCPGGWWNCGPAGN